jgi:Leucine-rich repeat (LRR) protein
MPRWPVQWLSKEFLRDPATKEALRRINEARKSGARELDLVNLKLSTLPEAISQLSQLQELNLYGNQLSTLPETVQSLESLEKLFLHGNPGLGLPDEVLGPAA